MTKHNTIGKGENERAVNGGLDKYYTKKYIADYYASITLERYGSKFHYIEPCAGNGSFIGKFPVMTAYDLVPEKEGIIKMDVFKNKFKTDQIIITNPPFGMNASLALSIFNHIASFKVKAICYIAPKTFKKKSLQNKLNKNYHLVFEQDVVKDAFTVDGVNKNVPCVFQIWQYKEKERIIDKKQKCKWFDFVSKDDANVAVRRVGGKAGQLLKGISHNENTTYFIKTNHKLVKKALQLIDLSVVDHTAGVRSISKDELCEEVNKIMEVLG